VTRRMMKACLAMIIMMINPTTALAESVHESVHIAFGSCSHQDKPQPIWQSVLKEQPDMFIFLGDNIYGDSDNIDVLAEKYSKLNAIPGVKALRAQTQVVATWDDHDYGKNDAGYEFIAKTGSRKLMLDFWDEPGTSPRRTQEGGIYTSYIVGESRKVQVILLDLRWNRTPLIAETNLLSLARLQLEDRGPYQVNPDPEAKLVGEAQWRWLENELQKEADVRVIATSIQFLAEFTGWESWANFPADRQRMISLLAKYQSEPIVFISGDVHWAEYSRLETSNIWPLIELTSSGLTEEWKAVSPNIHRVGNAFPIANYGVLDINFVGPKTSVELAIKDAKGDILIQQKLDVSN